MQNQKGSRVKAAGGLRIAGLCVLSLGFLFLLAGTGWADALAREPGGRPAGTVDPLATQAVSFSFVDGVWVSLAYITVMVLVRWMFVARPARRWADAHIDGARACLQIDVVDATTPKDRAITDRCEELLRKASGILDGGSSDRSVPGGLHWVSRALFWNGARERAAWALAHRAEQHAQLVVPDSAIPSRLWGVAAALDELPEGDAVRWERRIDDLAAIADERKRAERSRYLLHELSGVLYSARDARVATLAELQDKVFWITIAACALCLVLVSQDYGQLLLAGAIGGLLSRILMAMNATRQREDYGLSWSLLFAAPVAGAILAWGGLHVLVLLKRLNILALNGITELELSTLKNPGAIVMGIALILGTSARVFHRLVVGSEGAFSRTSEEEQATPTPVRPRPSSP